MEQLLKDVGLILGASYVDRVLDDEFLQVIFHATVKNFDIADYVSNGLSLGEKPPTIFASAGYSEKEKKVYLFDESQVDADYEVAVFMKNLPESKRIFAANLLRIISFFHEVIHAKQKKMMFDDDSYEADLLRVCHDREEFLHNYDLIPSERFAECRAIEFGLEILASSGLIIPELESYLVQKKYATLYRGYEDEFAISGDDRYSYPLARYMYRHNLEHCVMSEDEAVQTEPDLEKRLYYGWPITNEESAKIREMAGLDSGDKKVL